jgi:hypothetical protein
MRVVHCKKEKYDVYIGRPSKWGNPFVIGKHGDRAAVIRKYREWVVTQPDLMSPLPELQGKVVFFFPLMFSLSLSFSLAISP